MISVENIPGSDGGICGEQTFFGKSTKERNPCRKILVVTRKIPHVGIKTTLNAFIRLCYCAIRLRDVPEVIHNVKVQLRIGLPTKARTTTLANSIPPLTAIKLLYETEELVSVYL